MDEMFSEKEILRLYKEGEITETEYDKLKNVAQKPIPSSPQGYTSSKPNKELSFAFRRPIFSKEEQKKVLCVYVPFMVAVGALHLCGYRGNHFGDPAVGWILLLVWIGNLFFSWKNKRELLKRCILALLFASLTVVLVGLTVFEFSDSWTSGLLMFVMLTGGEENSKQFFVVRLIIGIVSIALFCVLVSLIKSGLTPP